MPSFLSVETGSWELFLPELSQTTTATLWVARITGLHQGTQLFSSSYWPFVHFLFFAAQTGIKLEFSCLNLPNAGLEAPSHLAEKCLLTSIAYFN
jgi:hypothetical protein